MSNMTQIQNAFEMLAMSPNTNAPKSMEEAKKKKFQFWETQPVPKFGMINSSENLHRGQISTKCQYFQYFCSVNRSTQSLPINCKVLYFRVCKPAKSFDVIDGWKSLNNWSNETETSQIVFHSLEAMGLAAMIVTSIH